MKTRTSYVSVEASQLPEKRERKPFRTRVYASNVVKAHSGPFYVQYWYDALGRVSVYFQEGEDAIQEFEDKEKNTFASYAIFSTEKERDEFVASL
jgi:hypothetical protein